MPSDESLALVVPVPYGQNSTALRERVSVVSHVKDGAYLS
jgi:hypothetical protein